MASSSNALLRQEVLFRLNVVRRVLDLMIEGKWPITPGLLRMLDELTGRAAEYVGERPRQ